MTLAAIVLHGCFVVSPALAAGALLWAAPPAGPATVMLQDGTNSQSQPAPTSTSSQTSPGQSAPAQPAQSTTSSGSQKPATNSKPAHKRKKAKVEQPNCNPTPANGPANTPSSSTQSNSGAKGAAAGTNNTAGASASSNCPPNKTVVEQGSAPEPSIQLAGQAAGSTLRPTNECPDATRCLQNADDNLKKIAGHELTSDQKDMVTQVRQFIDQSKDATKNGDLESARTLAWKAELLSEELANPEK